MASGVCVSHHNFLFKKFPHGFSHCLYEFYEFFMFKPLMVQAPRCGLGRPMGFD